MLPSSEFLVHIKFLIFTLVLQETIVQPFSFFIFFLILSSMMLILHAMDVFIKGLVGFWSLKTNILLAPNVDLLWKVTFQDIIYFSMFVTCFQGGFFPPFTFPTERNHPEMSPLPSTCSLEIYMHLAFQIKLIYFSCKAKLSSRIL